MMKDIEITDPNLAVAVASEDAFLDGAISALIFMRNRLHQSADKKQKEIDKLNANK